jgi:hypothetical protein
MDPLYEDLHVSAQKSGQVGNLKDGKPKQGSQPLGVSTIFTSLTSHKGTRHLPVHI